MNSFTSRILLVFLPIALGLTLVLTVTYINEQQILRLGANEPQIQLAIDTANALGSGATSTPIVIGKQVAIEKDLSPYVIIYDEGGKPIAGNGVLHGKLPTPPLGIFDVAKRNGSDLLTWEPEKGVRQAIVVEAIKNDSGGYVLSGRSLTYVEWEEDQLLQRVLLGWAATMVGTLFVMILLVVLARKKE
jgi:hypothetical protein